MTNIQASFAPQRPELTARYLVESSVAIKKVEKTLAGEQSSTTFIVLLNDTHPLKAAPRHTA
jgi:hypothetical protein